ncbi:hypothetical protein OH492_09995 [Vibrio chagasii]|nr:hypothetical protein [Vibrio chagasii]
MANKRIDFTPYSSVFALIENVNVVVEGDLSLSQDPVEFVEQYFDFITKVGFNQSAKFLSFGCHLESSNQSLWKVFKTEIRTFLIS